MSEASHTDSKTSRAFARTMHDQLGFGRVCDALFCGLIFSVLTLLQCNVYGFDGFPKNYMFPKIKRRADFVKIC